MSVLLLHKILRQKDLLKFIPLANYTQNPNQTDPSDSREIKKGADRSRKIPVETSIKYLESEAYKQTYNDHPVWVQYRRNYKGAFQPKQTRKTCIRQEKVSTGNPCPICRDEYLVLHELNVNLLKQFICPHTGTILSYTKTGVCKHKHQELTVAIMRAKDRGLITFDVPHRAYDYAEYQ